MNLIYDKDNLPNAMPVLHWDTSNAHLVFANSPMPLWSQPLELAEFFKLVD